MKASRRSFLKGLAGTSVFAIGGCASPFGRQKVKLAVVGVMGRGYSDWMPLLKSGLVEIVAFCDADYAMRAKAQSELLRNGIDFDMSRVPFYTDYRRLLDEADVLGAEALTVSTPDHVHAPVAIRAMRQGLHVCVQTPLVRTLWELDSFNRTAKENGVITQMVNQGSASSSLRRCVEVLRSGILGEVRQVHVWTNRPAWPQGKALADYIASRGGKGDPIPDGLNWNAFVATAKDRPYLGKLPEGIGLFRDGPRVSPNVYHTFNWRGSVDFGTGALGDAACDLMNLPFRGLELGAVSSAELLKANGGGVGAYPVRSIVKLAYRERESKVLVDDEGNPVLLPPVALYWYDGDFKPPASVLPKWCAARGGKVPETGCCLVGSKGAMLMEGGSADTCSLALKGDRKFVSVFSHEAARGLSRVLPFCENEDHCGEFVRAVRGEGVTYGETHSRCFSDVAHSIPLMEGILVGCVVQRVGGRIRWNGSDLSFDRPEANALVRPHIRKGWEF